MLRQHGRKGARAQPRHAGASLLSFRQLGSCRLCALTLALVAARLKPPTPMNIPTFESTWIEFSLGDGLVYKFHLKPSKLEKLYERLHSTGVYPRLVITQPVRIVSQVEGHAKPVTEIETEWTGRRTSEGIKVELTARPHVINKEVVWRMAELPQFEQYFTPACHAQLKASGFWQKLKTPSDEGIRRGVPRQCF